MKKISKRPAVFFLSLLMAGIMSCSSEEAVTGTTVAAKTPDTESFRIVFQEYAKQRSVSRGLIKDSKLDSEMLEASKKLLRSSGVSESEIASKGREGATAVISMAIKTYTMGRQSKSTPKS